MGLEATPRRSSSSARPRRWTNNSGVTCSLATSPFFGSSFGNIVHTGVYAGHRRRAGADRGPHHRIYPSALPVSCSANPASTF
jgi:hypothetical protein